jgi:nucleotide-binding universal stress UspA family protein
VIESAPTPMDRARLAGGPVVACIGDRTSGRSVGRIADVLARSLGARVLLATVQQPTPATTSGDDGTAEMTRRSVLTATASALGQPAELRVTVGEPAERLLALAERERAQLVVVAAPRRTSAPACLLGNVHLALAGAASCPVVIVPRGVSVIPAAGPVVCGVDGSASSQAAQDLAADLARRLQSRLVLVREADRLLAVAEHERAQVVVTASRGPRDASSTLLGSVASRLVLAATRPVVVVPA